MNAQQLSLQAAIIEVLNENPRPIPTREVHRQRCAKQNLPPGFTSGTAATTACLDRLINEGIALRVLINGTKHYWTHR